MATPNIHAEIDHDHQADNARGIRQEFFDDQLGSCNGHTQLNVHDAVVFFIRGDAHSHNHRIHCKDQGGLPEETDGDEALVGGKNLKVASHADHRQDKRRETLQQFFHLLHIKKWHHENDQQAHCRQSQAPIDHLLPGLLIGLQKD